MYLKRFFVCSVSNFCPISTILKFLLCYGYILIWLIYLYVKKLIILKEPNAIAIFRTLWQLATFFCQIDLFRKCIISLSIFLLTFWGVHRKKTLTAESRDKELQLCVGKPFSTSTNFTVSKCDCKLFFLFLFLLPSLPGLCYFMKEIMSRRDDCKLYSAIYSDA
jgi:hypothetical protein